jgi:tRNA splicing ligase
VSKPIVRVTWLDATRTSDDITGKDKPVVCKTVGYLLKRNKNRVVVATDQNKASGYRGGFVIPRKMVLKVRFLSDRG